MQDWHWWITGIAVPFSLGAFGAIWKVYQAALIRIAKVCETLEAQIKENRKAADMQDVALREDLMELRLHVSENHPTNRRVEDGEAKLLAVARRLEDKVDKLIDKLL